MLALSIKQPWASLIVNGAKDIENRSWPCPKKYIGQRVLIHASSHIPFYKIEQLVVNRGIDCWQDGRYPEGAIVGSVVIVDCVVNHPSTWAEVTKDAPVSNLPPATIKKGYGVVFNWVLANPILFEKPIPTKGKLGFWNFQELPTAPPSYEFPKDANGCTVKIGDKVKGEGFIRFHDGFKIDRSPVVTVNVQNGELYFGSLSAKSFNKFWIVNEK